MPVLDTAGWEFEPKAESRFITAGPVKLPVFVRRFTGTHDGYAAVYPQGKLSPDLWKQWVGVCQRHAYFEVQKKLWIWSWLSLERKSWLNESSTVDTPYAMTKDEREKMRADRKLAETKFNEDLLELSKAENVPEELWNTFTYPSHYAARAGCLSPTALQRIVVQRYWDRPYSLIAASVGTGKSRMVVDIMSSRAVSPKLTLRDSARILLIVAPLSLHENWKREFEKWAPQTGGLEWHVHKFKPTRRSWNQIEDSATRMFDHPSGLRAGGLVIIVTPNALSRPTLSAQFKDMGYVPTAIVVDECQRFFRKPSNSAYKNLMTMRKEAHFFIGLSGTPTSKFEDWWALENLMSNADPSVPWKGATFIDYEKLGSRDTLRDSGLWERGWDFNRAIKEYHAQRIRKGHIFVADKFYYMKDSLPGIGQEELGDFADHRLGFQQLFEDHPEFVKDAMELQRKEGGTFGSNAHAMATVLLLRMRQIAALSSANDAVLESWVGEFLDAGESGVVWVEFVNDPCNQLDHVVDQLNRHGPTCYIKGGMSPELRQEAIDGFQAGKYRFIVCQIEAAGVGLTLTKACKSLFLTIPLGYLSTSQAIGRLHRLGQSEDVTSYFAMTSPVAAFARGIYDRRTELNETIPKEIMEAWLPKEEIVDSVPVAA